MLRLFLMLACLMWAIPSAYAQNTSGVSSPVVNEGQRSLEYRVSLVPNNSAGDTIVAQRLNYHQSLSDDLMLRFVGQVKNTAQSDVDLDYLQLEVLWEITENDAPIRTGLRFDARLRDGSGPEQLGVLWANMMDLDGGWNIRGDFVAGVQLGDNAKDGMNMQARWQASKKLEGGQKIGVEMFNNFGNTGSFGSFNTQKHTAGPFISFPVGNNLSLFTGALFGLSTAATDTELRVWLKRKF